MYHNAYVVNFIGLTWIETVQNILKAVKKLWFFFHKSLEKSSEDIVESLFEDISTAKVS